MPETKKHFDKARDYLTKARSLTSMRLASPCCHMLGVMVCAAAGLSILAK
jgi:hypothetical protein